MVKKYKKEDEATHALQAKEAKLKSNHNDLSVKIRLLEEENMRLKQEIERYRESVVATELSEEKFRLLFETERDAIVVIDLQSRRIVDVNPAALDLYGYDRAEMLSMSAVHLSADTERSSEILGRLAESNEMKPEYTYGRHRRKDGTVFPIEAAAARFEWQNQKMLHAVFRDVTEREVAENRVRASEQRFKQLFEHLPDAVFISHIIPEREGEIVDVNQAAADQTGYTRQELVRMNINHDLRVGPPDGISNIRKKLVAGKNVVFIENKRRKNGTTYLTEVHITTIEHDGQKLAISVNRDITAQREAEEQVRKLYGSVEQSPVSVIITDTAGNIEYVNPKFAKVTGYSREEVIGKNPRILKSGEMKPAEYSELWETLVAGNEWQGEFHNRKKNGELFWEHASISPIKDEKGIITHYLGIKEEITERKRLQQELIQAQKMESIGNLAGGIAHDFNNLLTVINGHAEIGLMKLEKNHPAHRDLVSILHGGKRAENLTRQLLAFSRKQIYETKIININEIITGLEKMLRRLIGEDITIKIKLDRSIGKIKADPIQIEQIIINIVVNARDAINEWTAKRESRQILIETGEVYLDENYLRRRPEVERGKKVFVAISDNGKGMNRDVRDRIFEPFFTTKEKGKGTGLGLATVYGIVKQNRGHIYVYSEPDLGTTFKIYWNLTEESAVKQDLQPEDRKKMSGSENLLLVEDDDNVRSFALNALKEFGYNVYEAQNGKSALAFMLEKGLKIDLLITDMIMPEMNGKELALALHKISPGTKVLYTSGYTGDQLVENGRLEQDINFLNKPYSIDMLARGVRKVLETGSPMTGRKIKK